MLACPFSRLHRLQHSVVGSVNDKLRGADALADSAGVAANAESCRGRADEGWCGEAKGRWAGACACDGMGGASALGLSSGWSWGCVGKPGERGVHGFWDGSNHGVDAVGGV
jgi:hypothetical protein